MYLKLETGQAYKGAIEKTYKNPAIWNETSIEKAYVAFSKIWLLVVISVTDWLVWTFGFAKTVFKTRCKCKIFQCIFFGNRYFSPVAGLIADIIIESIVNMTLMYEKVWCAIYFLVYLYIFLCDVDFLKSLRENVCFLTQGKRR